MCVRAKPEKLFFFKPQQNFILLLNLSKTSSDVFFQTYSQKSVCRFPVFLADVYTSFILKFILYTLHHHLLRFCQNAEKQQKMGFSSKQPKR
jgi:hypothetical protein